MKWVTLHRWTKVRDEYAGLVGPCPTTDTHRSFSWATFGCDVPIHSSDLGWV